MRGILSTVFGVILIAIVPQAGFSGEVDKAAEIGQDCDLVGADLDAFPAADAAACLKKCLTNKECRGISFISGWNHCALKKSVKRLVPGVFMVAAERNGETFSPASHHDYSGKDLKNALLKTSDACQQACLHEPSCVGYTFIAGYDTCWMKKTKGKLYAKIFYCHQT